MNNEQLIEKLQELKRYTWLETGNGNMLYGKREYINEQFDNIISNLKPQLMEFPIHPCWCGNQETCDCISDPHDNDEWGEMIPLPNSRVLSKEEMEKYNKVKLPF